MQGSDTFKKNGKTESFFPRNKETRNVGKSPVYVDSKLSRNYFLTSDVTNT
jgi:hypothetical protein